MAYLTLGGTDRYGYNGGLLSTINQANFDTATQFSGIGGPRGVFYRTDHIRKNLRARTEYELRNRIDTNPYPMPYGSYANTYGATFGSNQNRPTSLSNFLSALFSGIGRINSNNFVNGGGSNFNAGLHRNIMGNAAYYSGTRGFTPAYNLNYGVPNITANLFSNTGFGGHGAFRTLYT